MTIRWTIYSLAATFNLVCSFFMLWSFFTLFPKLALAYFFVSLPVTIYVLISKHKYLDTNLADVAMPKRFALGSNPF